MEVFPYQIYSFQTVKDICYLDLLYNSYILELHKSNKDFCLYFTELINNWSVRTRPRISLEKVVVIKYVEIEVVAAWLTSPYPERSPDPISNSGTIKGVVCCIEGLLEKLYIKFEGNEQEYFFAIDREYLVHWVYNIAYSYKHGVDLEMEVNKEIDIQTGFREIINIKPGKGVYKAV